MSAATLTQIIQAIATLGTLGSTLYLLVTGQPVPELLSALTWALLGLYTGQRIERLSGRG